MATTLLVRLVVIGGLLGLLFVAFMVWLYRRKSRRDATNYRSLTGTCEVDTVFSVEKYTERAKHKAER